MGTSVFPALPGITFPVNVTEVWDTTVQQSISGKETRIARQSYPRRKYQIPFSVLHSAAAYTEYQQMVGFFNGLQGQFDTFLFADADDSSVTGQGIGTGNGTTAAFQLVRGFGGFAEPVLAPNVLSAVYLNGYSIPASGFPEPNAPTLSYTPGGSFGARTYYVGVTWQSPSGETLSCPETSIAVPANNLLVVHQPTPSAPGIMAWRIYASISVGTEQYQATVSIGASSWTEPSSGLISGPNVPSANTTGWIINLWGTSDSNGPGVLRFGQPVANGIPITTDFTYYWPCRMTEDSLSFSMFLRGMYELKKFSFITVKN